MIVGFGHVKQSGKDTSAQVLIDHFGFRRIGFADKMKECLLALDPYISAYNGIKLKPVIAAIGWEEAKRSYPELRRLLQMLGTEVGRELFWENFWVDLVLGDIEADENVVFSDVRFVNEAETIKKLGGYVIRIDRPGYVAEGHISETALVDWDGWTHVIKNDRMIEDLQDKIVSLFGDTVVSLVD